MDDAYQFFKVLEQKRIEQLNINKLHQEGENMVEKKQLKLFERTSM